MSLEALYAKMAAGTAKYRPRIRERLSCDDLIEWTTTAAVAEMCDCDHDAALQALHSMRADGILDVRITRIGRKQLQWRRRTKEKTNVY